MVGSLQWMSSISPGTSTSVRPFPDMLMFRPPRPPAPPHRQVGESMIQCRHVLPLTLGFPNCDFELNYCDWHLDEELNGTEFFQFIRTKGSVHENSNDGPIVDHDMNKEGK